MCGGQQGKEGDVGKLKATLEFMKRTEKKRDY